MTTQAAIASLIAKGQITLPKPETRTVGAIKRSLKRRIGANHSPLPPSTGQNPLLDVRTLTAQGEGRVPTKILSQA